MTREQLLELVSKIVGKPVQMCAIVVSYKDGDVAKNQSAMIYSGASGADMGVLCGHLESTARRMTVETGEKMAESDQLSAFADGFRAGLQSQPIEERSIVYHKMKSSSDPDNLSLDTIQAAMKRLKGPT